MNSGDTILNYHAVHLLESLQTSLALWRYARIKYRVPRTPARTPQNSVYSQLSYSAIHKERPNS